MNSYKKRVREIIENIKTIYQVDNRIKEIEATFDHIKWNLEVMVREFGGVEYFKGKRILDLGCGSRFSKDNLGKLRLFEPWLCRTLATLGAFPVGVDISAPGEESFEYYSVNLLNVGTLNFFPDKSFDVIHSSLLLSSPSLEKIIRRDAERKQLIEELCFQTDRLLKKEGKAFLEYKLAVELEKRKGDK